MESSASYSSPDESGQANGATSATSGELWEAYPLEPAPLAVFQNRADPDHACLVWKGRVSSNRLLAAFKSLVESLSPRSPAMRIRLMTEDEGYTSFDVDPIELRGVSDFPVGRTTQYLEFQCLAHRPSSSYETIEDRRNIICSVFANLDSTATNLDDLQQSVGIDIRRSDFRSISGQILSIMVDTVSEFFPAGSRYQADCVQRQLSIIASRFSHAAVFSPH